MMGLSNSERISMLHSAVLIQYTRVTDRRNWRGIYALYHNYMLSRVKTHRCHRAYFSFSLVFVAGDLGYNFSGETSLACGSAMHNLTSFSCFMLKVK